MGPQHIRNVVLVGHGGTGKTTLAEAMLFAAGAITRMGRVEDGTTVCDFEPEEVERGISLGLSLAPFEWNGVRVNLIDTPGYAAFVGEARAALRAADLAVFVVSAVDGVEVQHELLWEMASEEGIARAFVINKLDRERADFEGTLQQLKERFGNAVAPLHVPIGNETQFRGVIDLVAEQAYCYDGADPRGRACAVPDDMAEREHAVHAALVEAVVETDDAWLERYLDDGVEPSQEELVRGFHAGICAATAFPVLCASATRLVGIDRLCEFFERYAPNPTERAAPPVEQGELALDPAGEPVAYVFKTLSDPYLGRVSLIRVFAGSIDHDQQLHAARDAHAGGRMHNVFYLRGKEHVDVGRLVTGDIAAVAKIEAFHPGDTLVNSGPIVQIEPVPMPPAVMSVAIFPRSQADEDKLSGAVHKLVESDQTLHFERRDDTHESVLSGLGDTHLDVTIGRLRRRFGVDVEQRTPAVAYRETITAVADVEGKHKKQSGGRGQYGVVQVRIEPAVRGAGFEFVDDVRGGAVPRQFVAAVEHGIREGLERGMLAGYPVVDVRAVLHDGKYHAVDSDEHSFRMAGVNAVRAAAERARPVLLEPLVKARIHVPEAHMGDVIGDINAKRGQVLGMEFEGDTQVVTVLVPQAEMQRYSIDLRQITGGRGTFELAFDHYAEVPGGQAHKLVEAQRELSTA